MKRRPKARKVIVHDYPIYHRPDLEQLEKRAYLGSTLDALGMGLLGSSLAFLSLDQFDQAVASNVALRHLGVGGPAVGSSGSVDPYADVSSIPIAHLAAWPLHDAGEDGSSGTTAPAPEVVAGLDGDTLPWDDFMDGLADPGDGTPHAPFHFSEEAGLGASSFAGGGGSGGVAPGGAAASDAGTLGPLVVGGGGPTEAELTSMLGSSTVPTKSTPSSGTSQPPATPTSPPSPTASTPAPASPAKNQNDQVPPPPPPDGSGTGPGDGSDVVLRPHLPLQFEANRGQMNAQAQFRARGSGYNLFLTSTEMVLAMSQPIPRPSRGGRPLKAPPPPRSDLFVVRMGLVGANSAAQLTGLNQLQGVTNYLIGNNSAQWVRNIPNYTQVSYQGVYPGIDMLYYGNNSRSLEYDFTVAPGADPGKIQLAFSGQQGFALDSRGNLVLHTPLGDVIEDAPVIYQTVNGVRKAVQGGYVAPDAGHVSFRIGTYDHTLPLVIDPVLGYSTYLGGSSDDEGNAIAVDSGGYAYVTGLTWSTDFPTTSGVYQSTNAGSMDAFVTKITPSGTSFQYSTYLGGSGSDDALGIAVDPNSDPTKVSAYVTGLTTTPGGSTNFPTTPGAFQTTLKGPQNAFVTKLSTDGSSLVYSTLLGGGDTDSGTSIAVDGTGHAYVAGLTTSGGGTTNFPTTPGAFQTTLKGPQNAFVAQLSPDGTALAYSSYLGGSGTDAANAIAVDGSGNAYVTGLTNSSGTTGFPTTPGAFQTQLGNINGAYQNAFVTKVNPNGTGLVYSTYLGGSGVDAGKGIAVDGSGDAYVTGSTNSGDFPTTSGVFQPQLKGAQNAFISEVAPSGAGLQYSTYLGGDSTDDGNAIAVDSSGTVYVTGDTASQSFPTTPNPLQQYLAGQMNAFVAEVTGAGTTLNYSTYLGGNAADVGTGIAVDGNGSAYVTGYTSSNNFPTLNPIQVAMGDGPNHAFVTKINPTIPGGIQPQAYNQVPATEGVATGLRKLAFFTDGAGQQSDYATVDWGDGTPIDDSRQMNSNVKIQYNSVTCVEDILGTHLYQDEGSYVITITIFGSGGTSSQFKTGILVQDAALAGYAKTFTTTIDSSGHQQTLIESLPLSAASNALLDVASFSDVNPNAATIYGEFTANIDWGDGHASPATVAVNNGHYPNDPGTFVVLNQYGNNYAHAGVYPITVQIQDKGGSRLLIQSSAVVADAPLTVTPPSIFNCSSLSVSGVITQFNEGIFDPPTGFIATINWGDGFTSPGTVTEPPGIHNPGASWSSTSLFSISGAHTYPASGTYYGTVTVFDQDGTSQTVPLSVAVGTGTNICGPNDPPPPPVPDPRIQINFHGGVLNVQEGQAISFSWDYVDATNPPSNLAWANIEINWGDGNDNGGARDYNKCPGQNNVFCDSFTNVPYTYTEDGTFTVTIEVSSATQDPNYSGIRDYTFTAVVTEAPVINVTLGSSGPSLTIPEGQKSTGSIMTFTRSTPLPSGQSPRFVALIKRWDNPNDGFFAGTVQPHDMTNEGAFDVFLPTMGPGSEAFTQEGAFLLQVKIIDNNDVPSGYDQTSCSNNCQMFAGTVTVTDPPPTFQWQNNTGTAGQPFNLTATVLDSGVPLPSYYAVIDWGDGTAKSSTYISSPQYSLSAFHTYTAAGNYTTTVVLYLGPSSAEVEGQGSVNITINPANSGGLLHVQANRLSATEGAPLNGGNPVVVATVEDDNQPPRGGLAATIDWGDGSFSMGTVSCTSCNPNGPNFYNVLGSHTYGEEGLKLVKVTITYFPNQSVPGNGTVTVNDAPLNIYGTRLNPAVGAPLIKVLVATFQDPYPEDLMSYGATIVWGDGTVSTGQVCAGLNGSFYVIGTKPATQPGFVSSGTYTATVTVTEDGFPTAKVTSTITVSQAGVAMLSYPLIAVLNDPTVNEPGSAFDLINQVAISWADGSPNEVIPGYDSASDPIIYSFAYSGGHYGFRANHIYRLSGPSLGSVAYTDEPGATGSGGYPGGASVAPALPVFTATVPAPPEVSNGPGVLGTMNQPLTSIGVDYRPTGWVALATFSDMDPLSSPSNFAATIIWGDGTQSAGAIELNPGNSFTILGSHTYSVPGKFPITVLLVAAKAPTFIWTATCTWATIAPDTVPHQRLPGTRVEVGTGPSADGGQVTVAPNNGALQVYQPLDFRVNHDSSLDGFIDVEGNPLQGMTSGDDRHLQDPAGVSSGIQAFSALVYSSDSVSVRPIGEVYAYFDPSLGVPTNLQLQLTFNGTTQPWVTFSTGSHQPGDTYLLGAQVANSVAQSGVYPWTFHVQAAFANSPQVDLYYTGTAMVVANDNSQFGAGWTLDGLNQLVIVSNGALMTYGSGAAPRLFTINTCATGNTFVSPPDDFGTLTQTGTYTYTYTSKYGITWTFDATNTYLHRIAVLQTITDPHNLAATFTYDFSNPATPRLTTLQWPDGGTTTFTPNAIQEPGGRQMSLGIDGNNNLTNITDVDNSLRTFTYDGPQHHLTGEQWSPVQATYLYDATGVVTSITWGQGTTWSLRPSNIVALASSASGPLSAVAVLTNPRSFPSTYTLDFLGWLTRLDTPDGSSQFWGRDPSEQVNSYTDALGRSTIYQYGKNPSDAVGKGDLVQVNYPDGSNNQFQYDSTFHRRTLYQDGNQNVTQYGYNTMTADLTTITNAVGSVTREKWYDSTTLATNGLLASITDALNRTTSFQYYNDGSRRLQIRYDALGGQTSMLYDAVGNVTQITDARGNATHFTADARGRLLTRIDAAGNTASSFYDALGNVTGTVDADTNRTTFLYDGLGRKTVTIDAATNRTTALYDAAGNVTGVQGPLTDPTVMNVPQLVSFSYDALNRLIERTEAAQQAAGTNSLRRVTTTLYDAVGNVAGILSPAIDNTGPRLTSFAYDGLNRQIGRTDAAQPLATALRRSTATLYDLAGNVTQVTDADGHSTLFLYDALNRQTVTIDALGHPTTTLYDPVGNVTGIYSPAIDATGVRLTSFLYDALNRRTFTTESATTSIARTTSALYDAVGNVTETFDANGNPTQFLYDNLNRQTVTIDALGNRTTTVYDGVGNVTSVTSPSPDGNPLGRQTTLSYDALNRRVATTEAVNIPAFTRTSTVLYDALGNVTGVYTPSPDTNPLGRLTTFLYDALNRRVQTTEAVGTLVQRTSTTLYDAADNVTKTIDALGRPTQFQYDALSRQTVVIDALGNRTTTLYDPVGNVTAVYSPSPDGNPQGRLTVFLYDALNRRVQTTEAANTLAQRTSTTLYDAVGDVIVTFDALGRPTQYLYDSLGRRTATIDALNNQTATNYDAVGNVTGSVDALGRLTSYSYDKLNRRVATTEAATNSTLRRTTTVLYDAVGDVTGTQGPLIDPTTMTPQLVSFSYDALGRQTGRTAVAQQSPTSPLRQVTTMLYDIVGNLTGVYSPSPDGTAGGQLVSYSYDALNRRVETTEAATNAALRRTSTMLYDAVGNVTAQLTPKVTGLNNQTQFLYDALNRKTVTIDAGLNRATVLYDGAGDVTSSTDVLGHQTTFSYDALGRRIETTEGAEVAGNPLRWVSTNLYDAVGNVTGTLSPLGASGVRLTSFLYDALNRQVETTVGAQLPVGSPQRETTTTIYDAVGNVLAVVDARGNRTSYLYDDLNRQTVTIDANTNRMTVLYDAANNMTQSTDRDGRVRQFLYDALNRRTKEIWLPSGTPATPVATFSYDYNAANELIDAGDQIVTGTYASTSNVTFTFDALGHESQIASSGSTAPTITLQQNFDPADERTTLTALINGTNDFTNTYLFDALGRMTNILQTTQMMGATVMRDVQLGYYADGSFQSIKEFQDANAMRLVLQTSYGAPDSLGRLPSLQEGNTANPQPIALYTLLYDASDRLTQLNVSTISGTCVNTCNQTYSYDAVDELTGVSINNQQTENYNYDSTGNRTSNTIVPGNRISFDGTYTYMYDAEGNRISRVGNGTTTTYIWDYRNRLIEVQTSGTTNSDVTFTYDVFDRRTSESVNGVMMKEFAYDGNQVIEMFSGSGASATLTDRMLYGPKEDQLLVDEQPQGNVDLWPVVDYEGSVVNYVYDGGAAEYITFVSYNSFGKTSLDSELQGEDAGYTGQEDDTGIGLYYYKARYYDPTTGTFISEDPGGFNAGDMNLYRYVGNEPTTETDPSGMAAVPLNRGAQSLSAQDIKAFKAAVQGLPTGNDLRKLIILQALNGQRADQGQAALDFDMEIDPDQAWVDAGKDAVILQMLRDFPNDGPRLLIRAGAAHLNIKADRFWFDWTGFDLKAEDRTIVLDETSRIVGFRRQKTVKEAATILHTALEKFTASNYVSRLFAGVASQFTANIRAGFKAAGLEKELRDYDALFDAFEADLAYSTNATFEVISKEGKSQLISAAAGPAIGVVVQGLVQKAKKLRSLGTALLRRKSAGVAIGGTQLPAINGQWLKDGVGGYVPQSVADRLRGRNFRNFDQFREQFWQAVAADPTLASQFARGNQGRMARGFAPVAPPSLQHGKQIEYQIHHIEAIERGGGVYDLDNLLILAPRPHMGIHNPQVFVPTYKP